jgi:rRNA-processing protein FCF1
MSFVNFIMKKIILDTNFILTCVKQKIDFFEYLEEDGFEISIPEQVILELEKIINSKKKLKFREFAELSLKLLERSKFKKIKLEKEYVDRGIIDFAEKHREFIVATLDKEIKQKIKNKKLIIRGKKKLEII